MDRLLTTGIGLLLLLVSGCVHHCSYSPPSAPFLVVLVDAPDLDYANMATLLQTVVKHPATGNKESSVGHAWIYLEGKIDERKIYIECGHSGEWNGIQPSYFRSLIDAVEQNHPNPIAIFWENRFDGYCEAKNGGHYPTCAARFPLTQEQFLSIYTYITTGQYDFTRYNITQHHCCHFVRKITSLADIDLSSSVVLNVPPYLLLRRERLPLWEDPTYSYLSLETPDTLAHKLHEEIEAGKAKNALQWYSKRFYSSPSLKKIRDNIALFPERYARYQLFKDLTTPDV